MKILAAFTFSALLLTAQADLNSFKELKYRSIGPFRGGRVDTVAGVDLAAQRLLLRRHRRRSLENH